MPGLIQQAGQASKPTTPATGKGQMDPILTKARQMIESKLPAAMQNGYQQIVVAGMKILYSPQTHPKVQQIYDLIQQSNYDPQKIATGVINLINMVAQSSGGKMQIQAAYPAAVTLLTYVLDDLEKTRGLKVTPDLLKTIGKQMARLFVTSLQSNKGAQPPGGQPASPQPMPNQGVA